MASFVVQGFTETLGGDIGLENIPESVMFDMLDAEADVVERAHKAKAEAYEGYDTRTMIESIKRGKKIRGKNGCYVQVQPQGKRQRGERSIRNAEIAYLNEYGMPKRGIAPRPFIRDANEECADEAVAAAEKVYDAYLNKKGL